MAAKRRTVIRVGNKKKDRTVVSPKVSRLAQLPRIPQLNHGIGKTQLSNDPLYQMGLALSQEVNEINKALDSRIEKIISDAWEDQDLPFSQWYSKHGKRTE